MKTNKLIKKNNIAEMRLYEILGVKLFRKVVLLFERIRHFKDGGHNENYHPRNTENHTLRCFSGYLIYNTMFHIVSLMLVAIYFTATRCLSMKNIVIDCIMVGVTVVDVYCIMLQRYIYLRFCQRINNRKSIAQEERKSRVESIFTVLCHKDFDKTEDEIAFLEDVRVRVLSGDDVVLTSDNEEVLSQISGVVSSTKTAETSVREALPDNTSFMGLINALPPQKRVIGSTQYRTSALQKILRFDKTHNVMFGVCVITENAIVESYYRAIFSDSSLDQFLETLDTLLEAYQLYQKERMQK